jgi:hypothetical protein
MRRLPRSLPLRILEAFRTPEKDHATFAPWRGHFGVNALTVNRNPYQWWGENPIYWLAHYRDARKDCTILAAFLYFRLTKHHPAVILATHLRTLEKKGARCVSGNA